MQIKLSLQETLIVGVVVILIITIFYAMFVWIPLNKKINDVREIQNEEIKNAKAAISTLERLQQIKKESAVVESKIMHLSQRMPDSPEIPSLIIELEEIAIQSGMDMVSFRPSEPAIVEDNFREMAINLNMKGAFNRIQGDGGSLLDFIYRLENFPREFKLSSLSISPTEVDDKTVLSVNLQMSTFIMGTGEEGSI